VQKGLKYGRMRWVLAKKKPQRRAVRKKTDLLTRGEKKGQGVSCGARKGG